MRSSELARSAGITTRTLRHYHQVGLLPEPPRSGNGYRDYDPSALVTLLRIRRLVDLGFPLARISDLLRASAPVQEEVYDDLDSELAARIEHLTRQRETLARLRSHGAPPDLPPELAAPHDTLRRSGLPARAAAMDRDHTLLLTAALGTAGAAYVTAVYDLVSRPDRAAATVRAMTAWADLDEDSTEDRTARVLAQLTAMYVPVLAELAADGALDLPGVSGEDLERYGTDHLTGPQRAVLRRLREALERTEAPGEVP